MQYIQINLTKRELGFLYASLSHHVRYHEFYGKIKGADFSEIKLYLSELAEMAELAQKIYSYFSDSSSSEAKD